MSEDRKSDRDWGDYVVWGFILSVGSAILGGVTGIEFLQLIPVVFILPLLVVIVIAAVGQVFFTAKDIKKNFKKTFGGGKTFGKRSNRR